MTTFFENRQAAAKKLAEVIQTKGLSHPIVFGLARGGALVGWHVSKALACPFDVLISKKIGAPFDSDLALGAVIEDVSPYLNREFIRILKVPASYVADEVAKQQAEVDRQVQFYRAGRARLSASQKDVLIVDDGIGTGATARAAIDLIKSQKPSRIILAIPVMPDDLFESFAGLVDEVICLERAKDFVAVGQFYRDFSVVSETDVKATLRP